MQPPPVPTDDAVQLTHVDAALAKIACAQLNYFEDRWTEQLVRNRQPHARSPLIQRGYYSRVGAIRRSVTRFLELCPSGGGVQIVNLGTGFDTLYFWLRDGKNAPAWRDDLVYYEVDFPEVMSKKISAVLKKESLWPLLDATSQEQLLTQELSSSGTRQIRTAHCRCVSADMRITQELQQEMVNAGFRSDLPTMFIAECVLVYMQANHGDSIIEWASNAVPEAPSAMVVYEQTKPNDPFGKVMVENLMKRGCPLLSIHEYPTLDAQRERYQTRGWERATLADMDEIYNKYLDQKDVERIQRLEFLDEFEEWHLIQAHYFLLIATRAPGEPSAVASTGGADDEAERSMVLTSRDSWVHHTASVLTCPEGTQSTV